MLKLNRSCGDLAGTLRYSVEIHQVPGWNEWEKSQRVTLVTPVMRCSYTGLRS